MTFLKGYEIFEQLVLRVSVSDCLNFFDSRKKKKKKQPTFKMALFL